MVKISQCFDCECFKRCYFEAAMSQKSENPTEWGFVVWNLCIRTGRNHVGGNAGFSATSFSVEVIFTAFLTNVKYVLRVG